MKAYLVAKLIRIVVAHLTNEREKNDFYFVFWFENGQFNGNQIESNRNQPKCALSAYFQTTRCNPPRGDGHFP